MDDDIKVSDKAISINGVQVSWAIKINKLDYVYECLENTVLEVDANADAYATGDDEIESEDMRSLDDDTDVAWN
jgi:hypothetical protein